VPSFWGGLCVAPRSIEFWQGGHHRLHDRFKYCREGEGWRIDNLAP
jgi:pyridoxamine 5'-phosphate oxidase